MCVNAAIKPCMPKLSLGQSNILCSAPETGRRRATWPKAVVLLGSETHRLLLSDPTAKAGACLEHWLSSLSALSVETFEGWQPSWFLLIICERWQFCTDTDWEILILKVCKFNSKGMDIFVHCIKVLWDFKRRYVITNTVMSQHGSAADLVTSTVNLSCNRTRNHGFQQFSDT